MDGKLIVKPLFKNEFEMDFPKGRNPDYCLVRKLGAWKIGEISDITAGKSNISVFDGSVGSTFEPMDIMNMGLYQLVVKHEDKEYVVAQNYYTPAIVELVDTFVSFGIVDKKNGIQLAIVSTQKHQILMQKRPLSGGAMEMSDKVKDVMFPNKVSKNILLNSTYGFPGSTIKNDQYYLGKLRELEMATLALKDEAKEILTSEYSHLVNKEVKLKNNKGWNKGRVSSLYVVFHKDKIIPMAIVNNKGYVVYIKADELEEATDEDKKNMLLHNKISSKK